MMQVWSGNLAWPATKAALRAESCAASIARFGGAGACDRAGPAWMQQAGENAHKHQMWDTCNMTCS